METASFKTKIKRVLKSGLFNFWRSGYVSFAAMLIMIITLATIASSIFLGAILNLTLDELREKVDVNVYFLTTASEQDILGLKARIEALPEVARVEYVSREQALALFRARHENDQITLQALEELGDNPLGAELNVKAKDPSQYEGIADFLSQENILSSSGSPIIDKVNFLQNKTAIDRLTRIINSSERLGLALAIALIVVSIAITFNTIRLAIYISRDEISVMQLVGASKNFIRGPFVVTGILYGGLAGVIVVLLLLPVTYWFGSLTADFFSGLNVYNYYTSNILQMIGLMIGSGVAIGAASSYLAVRKYLKL